MGKIKSKMDRIASKECIEKKNGPRYWAMDSALDCSNIKQVKKNFGIFSFIKRANIDKRSIRHAMTKTGIKSYHPIPIKRQYDMDL